MPVTEVPDSGAFAKHIQTKGKLIVVDFYATCPCKAIAPFVDALSSKYAKEATFLKVDVDQLPDVSQAAGVQAMPSFGFYGDGRLVELQRGGDPRALEEKIKKYAAQFHKSAFTGSGYQLGTPGSAPSSASASATSAPAAASRPTSATTAAASPAAGEAKPVRKNPWANPDFFPGKKPGSAASSASSTSASAAATPAKPATASAHPPTVASATTITAAHSTPATQAPASAPTPAPATAVSAAPYPASTASTSAPSLSSSAPAVSLPPVNPALLQQMLDMGFSQVRAEKALLFTHNSDAEVAVGWLMEHQDDPDIDEPLQLVGSAPARPSAAGQSDVNLDDLDEDGRVLYEEMMRKKGREQASASRGGAGSSASSASSSSSAAAVSDAAGASSGAKRVSDMSSEEKMQWLADKRAQVKAKKEAEALEKVKTDYKSTKGMTAALNELKEQREEHERQQALIAKRKESADKEKQRRQIAERLAADKERRRKEQEKTMQQLQKAKEEKAQPGK